MELLSGVIMSTLVIGGLGYGLFQLTKVTGDEAGKVRARDESSRAIQFISDELRRAQSVVDLSTFTEPAGSVPVGGTIRLALNIPGLDNPVVYSVVPANDKWQGDLVIYRWGPPLGGTNGAYSTTGGWSSEPLLDGLDGENQPINCNGSPVTYQGFYACRRPDGITAQLYFTSGIDIANTDYDQQYTAEAEVVARARVSDHDNAEEEETAPLRFRTLGAEYSLGVRGGDALCDSKTSWTMRTEFINDPDLQTAFDPDSTSNYKPKTWIHDPDRQGQQIEINTDHKLTVASIPIGYDDCTGTILSRGNEALGDDSTDPYTHTKAGDGTTWTPKDGVQSSDFTIDFAQDNGTGVISGDPTTFNGNKEGEPDYDNPNIPGVEHVKVYKNNSIIANYPGYDDNSGDDNDPEQSLASFLVEKGYAEDDGNGNFKITNLKDNERIIAVEIGQVQEDGSSLITFPDGTHNPGFDLQDSVFILSTDKFDKEYPTGAF